MRIFYKLRCWIKSVLCRFTTVIEYCHDCGVRQPVVWTADDALWAEVTECEKSDDMPGIYCPTCFDRRANEKGLSLRWVPKLEGRR